MFAAFWGEQQAAVAFVAAASQTAGKSAKRIERCVISTFRIAESLGFRGDFRQWEHLLQVGG
jgi:hypothetical protein